MDQLRVLLPDDEARESVIVAMRENRLIGMAVGMLMERHRLDAAQAFDALRRQARSERTRLAQLAAHIVDGGAQLRTAPPPSG